MHISWPGMGCCCWIGRWWTQDACVTAISSRRTCVKHASIYQSVYMHNTYSFVWHTFIITVLAVSLTVAVRSWWTDGKVTKFIWSMVGFSRPQMPWFSRMYMKSVKGRCGLQPPQTIWPMVVYISGFHRSHQKRVTVEHNSIFICNQSLIENNWWALTVNSIL